MSKFVFIEHNEFSYLGCSTVAGNNFYCLDVYLFYPEFLKWAHPSLNVDIRAVSSGSVLFAEVSLMVCRDERVNILTFVSKLMNDWFVRDANVKG